MSTVDLGMRRPAKETDMMTPGGGGGDDDDDDDDDDDNDNFKIESNKAARRAHLLR